MLFMTIFDGRESAARQEDFVKKVFALSIVLASILLVAGCFVTVTPPTYTVSGGIGTYLAVNMYTPASLTLYQGSTSFPVSVVMPPMDSSNNQVGTYSISNVPAGTYNMQVIFQCNYSNVSAAYSVNSGTDTSANMTNTYIYSSPPYEYTETITGLSIGANTTVDVILQ
jgi:hypothetical protein